MKNFANQMKVNDANDVLSNVYVSNRRGVNKSFEETEFNKSFKINGHDYEFNMDSTDDRPERIIRAFFAATAVQLSKLKKADEESAVAITLQGIDGELLFTSIVKYNANTENPSEPGDWDVAFSFYKEDLAELEKTRKVKKYLYNDISFFTTFDRVARETMAIQFSQERFIFDACLLTINTLRQIIEAEANNGDNEIILPGFFIASSEVVDGEIHVGIAPDGHLKEIVKDDAALDTISY